MLGCLLGKWRSCFLSGESAKVLLLVLRMILVFLGFKLLVVGLSVVVIVSRLLLLLMSVKVVISMGCFWFCWSSWRVIKLLVWVVFLKVSLSWFLSN